jgi:hypothetical protein
LTGSQLADGAINSLALIADNLFTGATGLGKFTDGFWSGSTALGKFGDGLFTADATGRGKFANAFLVSSLIAAAAIGGGHIADGGILSGKYASQSIRTADLGLGQVVSSIIGANVIDTAHIRNQGILSASIGAAAVGNTHLAAEIDAAKLTQGLLPNTRISGLPYANLVLTNSIIAGDITTDAVIAAKIQAGAVISAKIGALAVGTGHLADNAIISGKLASGAIPDASVSEAQLVSGISIDIAESLSEPTTIAAEPISGHACVLFLSGFAGKRVGVALANNPNRMPAVGKIGPTAVASGASMTTNPILSYGRTVSPIGSGNVQKMVYVGTNGQPVTTPPNASGSCIQILGQVADNDGTMFLFPMPNFVQVAS